MNCSKKQVVWEIIRLFNKTFDNLSFVFWSQGKDLKVPKRGSRSVSTIYVLYIVNTASFHPHPPPSACQIPWLSFWNLICTIKFENSIYVFIYSLQLTQRLSCFRTAKRILLKSSLFVEARKMKALTHAVL